MVSYSSWRYSEDKKLKEEKTTISIHRAQHSPKPRGNTQDWEGDTWTNTPCTAISGKHDRSAALHMCKDKTFFQKQNIVIALSHVLPQLTVFEVLHELLLGLISNCCFQLLHLLQRLQRNYASLKPQRCLALFFCVLQTSYESLQQTMLNSANETLSEEK